MALEDDIDFTQTDASDNAATAAPLDLTNVNDDAPEFLKDLKIKKQLRMDIPLETEFIPQNPYTLDLSGKSVAYTTNLGIEGEKEHSSFLDTAAAEAYNFNSAAQAINAGIDKYEQPSALDDVAPPDWNPKTDASNFLNVQPQYMAYLLDSTGPKDQAYRLQKVYAEQAHDETLANGSFVAKLVGGASGAILDPANLIPIIGWAKYAKFGKGLLTNAALALPGAAAYSVVQSAAKETDRINGNMQDFLTDAFVSTVFGTVLFGAGGELAATTDKLQLWNLKSFGKDYIDGIDYKLVADKEGKITGYQAIDTTGSLSAAKVSFAQDLANSSFSKSGLFKIPYVGEYAAKLLGMPVFGSPLVRWLNSPSKVINAVIDRVADHSIITEGVKAGGTAPDNFATLMNQTVSQLRKDSVQMVALHTERNGIDIANRHLNGLVNLGLNLKDKSLKLLSQNLDNKGWISREEFDAEVEHTLMNEEPSTHGPVNVAASILRNRMDETYKAFRIAHNLPEDWMPPRTQRGYLTRVYNTPFMNNNQELWINSISDWLSGADKTIDERMEPINTLSQSIKDFEQMHTEAVHILGNLDAKRIEREAGAAQIEKGITLSEATKNEIAKTSTELRTNSPAWQLRQMRQRLRIMKDTLQNELRSNEDLNLHVHDWTAVSANEAAQIESLTKPVDDIEKQISAQKIVVSEAKKKASQKLSSAKNTTTVKNAIPKSKKFVEQKDEVKIAEDKLAELQEKHFIESDKIQEKIHNGEIDKRLYTQEPNSFQYKLKDPNDRLRFRDTYEAHTHRERAAKGYYDTIMNQTPEDTINQVMGKLTGNARENPLKQRTLLIPDKVLYDNGFMTKDVMAKVSNYVTYLARRTHLKNVFKDVTLEGGFEPIVAQLNDEHEASRSILNTRKAELNQQRETSENKKKIDKQILSVDKKLVSLRKGFESNKKDLNHLYDKMMGIQKQTRSALQLKAGVMSITAWASLPFVPLTQINDLAANGLQHGVWPMIRDGLYPVIESLGGILKTKDSQAFRDTIPSINLGFQDVQMGYADRNWGAQTNPYLNLGKIVNGLQKIAHSSANFTLTNYIDNFLQHVAGSVFQSNLMRILHDFKAGKIVKRDQLYIRKYGVDPEKWADRMVDAFKQDGGGKTKLGGYQSLFHQWQDVEAANKFGDAVFRSVKDTNINASIADSPLWTEDNGPLGVMGSMIRGFNGWGYASVNRYVIPSLQAPDAQKLLGVMVMLSSGAIIDPMRRMARGESPYPANITDKQKMWAAVENSGYFSFFANTLADANLFTDDQLIGDLRSDKYKDRTRAGLLGPAWSTANRLADVVSAVGSREWNKNDAKKAARLIPYANASWTYWMSQKLIEHWNIPENKRQAKALKGV